MKKKIILLLMLIPIVSGCEGDITRDIRHAGFSLSDDEFECVELIPTDDTRVAKVTYIDSNYAINEANEIFQISLEQKYSNNKNCKKDTSVGEIVATIDNTILKSSNNKLYYAPTTNSSITEIPITDDNLVLYQTLTGDAAIKKVITIDSQSGIYYILKDDGNVYEYVMPEIENTNTYQVVSTKILYNKDDYDGKIIDFNYNVNNQNSIFLKTINTYYRMLTQNEEDCTKYADVACEYEMQKDELLNINKDNIIYYNGSILYTDYNKIFTM